MRRFVFLKGLTMADSNYILTPEGRQKLEEELHYLETEKRAEVGERIKVAREFGDISENSEYDDAKNEQGMMEARIAEIGRILSEATVVEAPKRSSKVTIGSTVTVDMGGRERVLPSWAALRPTWQPARSPMSLLLARRFSATRRVTRSRPQAPLAASSR